MYSGSNNNINNDDDDDDSIGKNNAEAIHTHLDRFDCVCVCVSVLCWCCIRFPYGIFEFGIAARVYAAI